MQAPSDVEAINADWLRTLYFPYMPDSHKVIAVVRRTSEHWPDDVCAIVQGGSSTLYLLRWNANAQEYQSLQTKQDHAEALGILMYHIARGEEQTA